MTDDLPRPSDALLAEIRRDLRPVKPTPVPLRLTLRLAPIAVLASSVVLALLGVRGDALMLGPVLTWGPSLAQFGLAISLMWIAARESTPSRRLPMSIVWFAVALAGLAVVTTAFWTFGVSPSPGPAGVPPWLMGLVCGAGSALVGTLLVLFFGWVFRNSLAARPAFAGGLYGAAAGIAVNAGWRIACPVSTLGHTLGAHGAAIVLTTILGAVAGRRQAFRTRSATETKR